MPPPNADPLLQAARLVPVAYALHVVEEAPGFAAWVRRHAARDYTDAEFVRINASALCTRSNANTPPESSRPARDAHPLPAGGSSATVAGRVTRALRAG
jgi:hypothetical protein